MNHKASATCPNGHEFEWGQCEGEVKKMFGGTKQCGAKLFEQVYADGSSQTVSFDDRSWIAVECVRCHAIFESKACPECGEEVPVTEFKKKGFFSKLG